MNFEQIFFFLLALTNTKIQFKVTKKIFFCKLQWVITNNNKNNNNEFDYFKYQFFIVCLTVKFEKNKNIFIYYDNFLMSLKQQQK